LKKYATHFFNHAVGVTGEKEAANPVTDLDSTNHSTLAAIFNSTTLQGNKKGQPIDCPSRENHLD
jgi:hypothetical protein